MQTIAILFGIGLALIAFAAYKTDVILGKKNEKWVHENETTHQRRLKDIENGN